MPPCLTEAWIRRYKEDVGGAGGVQTAEMLRIPKGTLT